MQIDLHGYHPDDLDIPDLLRQVWETGATEVTLIHGHGRKRGLSPGFVNTNTGFFGLRVRTAIRGNRDLKPYVKVSTLNCTHNGSTTVKLKPNPKPTRFGVDLPKPSFPIDPAHASR
jgi:hypothetical protein